MDPSLLESESAEAQALLGKLLLESGLDPSQLAMGGNEQPTSGGIPYTKIVPNPGFCVKLKMGDGEKVFLNICHSENVPRPTDLTDAELLKVLESDDLTQFRIPMSIGEPHAEMDKSGSGCTVYDVIVHPDFLQKIQTSDLFKTFFLTVTCEGIEEKNKVQLKRDWVILKNRRCVGTLQEQTVRTKSKPLILDMDERAPEPKFSIVREPSEGHPEFLVAEIHLPQVVGEDRILLETRSNVYHLDIYLPYNLVQEDVGAQFDRSTKILTLTMPVQPES
ncbi:hypothetical protein BaRGS_00015716 [Batillaria attramentaria]|uniref:PIH1 domain-containing protein 1 n=1 Tax=Batillaria attramentaria TaxID=370345 RepID=A0ABD0L0C8_9CAEN